MKTLFVIALTLAVTLAGVASGPGLARADDETYVKVEIRGRFDPPSGALNPTPSVIADCRYRLNFKDLPGGGPTKKEQDAMEGRFVIVKGRLVLPLGEKHVEVRVTSIALDQQQPKE